MGNEGLWCNLCQFQELLAKDEVPQAVSSGHEAQIHDL